MKNRQTSGTVAALFDVKMAQWRHCEGIPTSGSDRRGGWGGPYYYQVMEISYSLVDEGLGNEGDSTHKHHILVLLKRLTR